MPRGTEIIGQKEAINRKPKQGVSAGWARRKYRSKISVIIKV